MTANDAAPDDASTTSQDAGDAMAKSAGLGPDPANRTPLSPAVFLRRSAEVYPDRTAVIRWPG
jgi:hypothetical protein